MKRVGLQLLVLGVATGLIWWSDPNLAHLERWALLGLNALLVGLGLLPYWLQRDPEAQAGWQAGHQAIWTWVVGSSLVVGLLPLLWPGALPLSAYTALLGLPLIAMGNVATKLRHGYAYGCVNRWTMASPTVWDKTHRLFGWLLVLVGAASIPLAFLLAVELFVPLYMAAVVAVMVAASVASYLFHRQAQGTSPARQA